MFGKPRIPRLASVQASLLDLEAIREDVLVLQGGDTRAVLEVGGLNLALKSSEEQDAILEGYRALINGLDRPVQLVSRTVIQDVQAYLDDLRPSPGEREPEALVRLRLDHFAFVQALAARRTLLHHRSFLALAGPSVAVSSAGVLLPFLRRPRGGGQEAPSFDAARRQLTSSAEELRQGLQGIGLAARRLNHQELVRLLHDVLAPQQAGRQRLADGGWSAGPVVSGGHSDKEVDHAVAA